jgi:hypothetical protein
MRHLIDLRGDQSQPLFGQPKKVDWNVERLVDAKFSDDSARYDIEILKALENSSESAGIDYGACGQQSALDRRSAEGHSLHGRETV